jgi:hypothetical protein
VPRLTAFTRPDGKVADMDIVITAERVFSTHGIVDSSHEDWIRAEELMPDGTRRLLDMDDPVDAEAYASIQDD